MFERMKTLSADRNTRRTLAGRALCLVLFLAGLLLVYRGLDYFVNDDTDRRTRVSFHDFYGEETLDSVFVGSSHIVRAIDAVTLSDTLGGETFNLGSFDQDLRGSYYMAKEAIEAKKVRHVYLEVSISKLMLEEPDETATYILSDYMRSLPNKVGLVTESFGSDPGTGEVLCETISRFDML